MMVRKKFYVLFFFVLIFGSLGFFAFLFSDFNITGFAIFSQKNQTDFDNGVYEDTSFVVNGVALDLGETEGNYTSEIFDGGQNVLWKNISRQANIPVQTSLTFQVRNCSSPDCSGEIFTGPGRNSTNFYTSNFESFNLSGRYFQYKFYFSSRILGISPSLTSLEIANQPFINNSKNTTVNKNEIIINSPNITENVLKRELIINVSVFEEGELWFSLDNENNISICRDCSEGFFILPSVEFGSHELNVFFMNKAGDVFNESITFIFLLDTDNDGITDTLDSDKDNDGIPDVTDSIIGDLGNIDTNFKNISLEVNRSTDFKQIFLGRENLVFFEDGLPRVEFEFDFSSTNQLFLGNISLRKQQNESFGGLYIDGISLVKERTKTFFVERINKTDRICLKDDRVRSLGEISQDCSVEGELELSCSESGIPKGKYSCIVENGFYKISGLLHSGVIEIVQVFSPPPEVENTVKDDEGGFAIFGPVNLTLLDFSEIKLRRGENQIVKMDIINSGKRFLNKCSLNVKGKMEDWINDTERKISLGSGQIGEFEFDFSVPIEAKHGVYESYLEISCFEVLAKLDFNATVLERDFDFEFIDWEREDVDTLSVNYSIEDFTGEARNYNVSYFLVNLEGIVVSNGAENVFLEREEKEVFALDINLPKDSFGEFLLKFEISNGWESSEYEEEILLFSRGITGLAISDENRRTLSIFGVFVFILIAMYFLWRFIKRKN